MYQSDPLTELVAIVALPALMSAIFVAWLVYKYREAKREDEPPKQPSFEERFDSGYIPEAVSSQGDKDSR